MIVDDVAKRHGGWQCIQAEDHIIPLKLQRALLYTPIREPTDWELKNLIRVMLTADEPWDPSNINDDMDEEFNYPDEEDVVDDDMRAYIFQACKNVDLGGVLDKQQENKILVIRSWLVGHICDEAHWSYPVGEAETKMVVQRFCRL